MNSSVLGTSGEIVAGPGLPRIASKAERAAKASVCASLETFDDPLDRDPELRMYRGRTVGMLRRYMRFSLETGRLPSLLGRELFRAKVTSYTVATFEDRVILVRDMEMALERTSEFTRQLIARYFLQEHDLFATARFLHCNEKTVRRSIPIALDELSEILLGIGLLTRSDSDREKSCQGGETSEFFASDCNEGENKRNYHLHKPLLKIKEIDTVKMSLLVDEDVRSVLQFMQDMIAANKLVAVADSIPKMARLLWEKMPQEPCQPISLELTKPTTTDRENQLLPTAT